MSGSPSTPSGSSRRASTRSARSAASAPPRSTALARRARPGRGPAAEAVRRAPVQADDGPARGPAPAPPVRARSARAHGRSGRVGAEARDLAGGAGSPSAADPPRLEELLRRGPPDVHPHTDDGPSPPAGDDLLP